jgi:hypothetical protein
MQTMLACAVYHFPLAPPNLPSVVACLHISVLGFILKVPTHTSYETPWTIVKVKIYFSFSFLIGSGLRVSINISDVLADGRCISK